MAELLVRVIDKVGDDLYKDTQCTKRGDVIVVKPDGWLWGKDELKLPIYRIIRVKLTVDEASIYLAPQKNVDPKQPSKTLLRRALKIDLDNPIVTNDVKSFLADSTRTTAKLITNFDINSVKVIKDSVADPSIIGVSPGII